MSSVSFSQQANLWTTGKVKDGLALGQTLPILQSLWLKGGRGGGLCDTYHGIHAEEKVVANFPSRNFVKAVS